MTVLLRGLRYLMLLLVVAAAAGAAYQWWQSAADRKLFPAPGKLVEVDGLQLHIDCRGSGTPTVILEAGLTSGSSGWGLVHNAMAKHTRICAYDRPGMDWSEPMNRTASAEEIAQRLHRLIEVSNIEGPYVLLGMSAGGVYVREYYQTYPEDVVGMILVDSSHEQQGNRLNMFDGENPMDQALTLCRWIQPLGIVRLFASMEQFIGLYDIPDEARAMLLANANQSHTCASMLAEIHSFADEVVDATPPDSLGDLPLMVLSQGNQPAAIEALGISLEKAREQRIIWNQLQRELTMLSSRGERQIARSSGHVIQLEQPQLVIDAVAAMVSSTRR